MSIKTFLVTGGLGFIGSHFIDSVLKQGHKVVNIDCETYASNKNIQFNGNYHYIKDDISKLKCLPFCDVIVNFAAESHVDNSISNSFHFLSSNVLGVYNILEILKNGKIESALKAWGTNTPLFVQISTDEVFGDIEEGHFKENDRHHASNPYSASKSAAEQLVVAWGRTYKIPYIITRTTNNYGPRQHEEKLIPKAITCILNNKKIPIHGNGTHIRNWIHVQDNVDAILTIIGKGDLNTSYHISSDEEYSVKQIVDLICQKMNVDYSDCVENVMDRSGADVRYALDNKKIKSLGWVQKKKIDTEIEKIIKSYREKNDSTI